MLGTKTKPDRQTDRHRQTPWPADVSLLAGSNEGNYSSRLDACSLLFSSLLFYYLSPLRDFLFDFHLSSLSLPFPHSHSPVFFFFSPDLTWYLLYPPGLALIPSPFLHPPLHPHRRPHSWAAALQDVIPNSRTQGSLSIIQNTFLPSCTPFSPFAPCSTRSPLRLPL